jgi:putative hydrolase of the HAD superfamily
MKLKNIKHVFFDLDHTLWDFDKNSALAFDKIFHLHQLEIDRAQFSSVYEPINLNYWKLYRDEKINKSNLRYQRLKDTFNAINFQVSDDTIYKLSEDYITYLTTFNHLFEGTFDILDHLKDRYQLHIITNGFDEAQQKKMDNANISKYFETITNSEIAGVKKPNPIIFEYALNIAKAKSHESIMIGDSLEADVLGAIDSGFDAILFNYHNHNPEPHIKKVNTLLDIKLYL